MKQINVETATREQLVDFIRRMHPQLQREQERVKELESQINGFQEFIHEKNAEIRELRQQSNRLTEKSASDEETIGALIKQMEDMRLEQTPAANTIPVGSPSSSNVPRGRTVEQTTVRGHPSGERNGNDRSPEAIRPADAPGNGDAGRRPSRTPPPLKDNADNLAALTKSQSVTAAALNTSKADDIAKLEQKVRELMEVNTFYSAIVAQHDQEENARMGQRLMRGSEQSEEDVAELRQELERQQFHISNLDLQEEKLQRIIKVTEAEKAVLRQENEALKKETVQLEAEMEEMTRDFTRARRSLAASASRNASTVDLRLTYAEDDASHARAVSAPQQGPPRDGVSRVAFPPLDSYTQQPQRRHASLPGGAAPRVSPLSYESRQGVLDGTGASPVASASASTASRSRFNFRSLRPIRVRNPDAHEKDLLDRIHLYEAQLAQLELFEADRQRSFDEMERNRAEMFAAMNEQLEKQRKEIHRLRKLHEDASLDSSLTARPSRNHSVGSMLNREEEDGRVGVRRHGSPSPEDRCLTAVPTSPQSLLNVESLNGIDEAEASFSERDTLTLRSTHQRRPAHSPAAAEGTAWQLEFSWREREERFSIWREAMESTVEQAVSLHSLTVQHYTEELAACNAKLLGEREELTSDLELLQRQSETLETQVAHLESELRRRNEADEVDAMAKGSADIEGQCSTAAENCGSSFLEGKAVCTARLALEAFDDVLQQYAALLHNTMGSGPHDVVPEAGEANLAGEVTHDLEEVEEAFDSLKKHHGDPVQLLHAAFPVELSISELADAGRALPLSSVAAAVVGVSEDIHDKMGAKSTSLSSSSSAHHDLREEAVVDPPEEQSCATTESNEASTSSPEKDDGEAEVSPTALHGETAEVSTSQGGSRRGSCQGEAFCDKDSEAVFQPDNDTMTTEYDQVDMSESEALAPLSVDEADGTATSQFADCVERDDGTSLTSLAPEEEEAPRFTEAVTDEDGDSERRHRVTRVASNSAEPEDSEGDAGGSVLAPSPESGSPVAVLHPTSMAAEQRDEGQAISGECAVELSDSDDSDTMSAPSQLDVTEAEEAEFLAQLQREMDDTETAEVTAAGDEEESHAAPINDSSSPTDSGGVSGWAKREGHHHLDETGDVADEVGATVAAPAFPTTTPVGEETSRGEKLVVLDASVEESPSSSSSEPFHSETDVERASAADEETVGGAPPPFYPNPSSTKSTASLSPNLSTVDVQEKAESAATQLPDGFAAADAGPSPVGSPSMIPPTSLDELFGGHSSVLPLVPPPTAAAERHSEAPQVANASLPTPVLPPDPYKPSSPYATFNTHHTGIPTLSPNSMFATPPRPVPFRTFFASGANTANSSPFQPAQKGARSRSASSSSDDAFEAGFDPFA